MLIHSVAILKITCQRYQADNVKHVLIDIIPTIKQVALIKSSLKDTKVKHTNITSIYSNKLMETVHKSN